VLAALCLSETARAEDSSKYKRLDSMERVDEKTLKPGGGGGKLKAVSTNDPKHPKVVEFTCDFRDANGLGGFTKWFPTGTVNIKKHAAIRFFVRSNSGTSCWFDIGGSTPRKDKKNNAFRMGEFAATEHWTEVVVPLEKIRRHSVTYYDKDKREHVVVHPGGDPPDDEDCLDFNRISFGVSVNGRGSSVTAHLQFDDLALVLK
jgi:hypothetical protein